MWNVWKKSKHLQKLLNAHILANVSWFTSHHQSLMLQIMTEWYITILFHTEMRIFWVLKKVLAVDHQFPPTILLAKLTSPCGFLFISSLRLILLFCIKVASLFCQIPSKYLRASSSPSLTQSMIYRLMLSTPPHRAKCLPSSLLMFITSCLLLDSLSGIH